MHVGVWRLGKQRVGPDNVIKDWFMLGWGAKWLFNSETQSDFVTGKEALKRDDKRICKSLWKLVNDSDIIITHNGIQFDVPKINTRFILNGLTPPAPYLMIDTKKIAYKQFGFSSNALNYLGKIMLSKEKIHTDYQLWIDCEEGKQESIDFMETYCKGDVGLLEEVYLELRPWIKSHPNLAIMMDAKDPCCPNCGSFSLTEENHYYTTPQNKYKVVRCNSCGAVNRRAISDLDLTPAQRKSRIVPSSR
jgi:RNase P subunit RPR2